MHRTSPFEFELTALSGSIVYGEDPSLPPIEPDDTQAMTAPPEAESNSVETSDPAK